MQQGTNNSESLVLQRVNGTTASFKRKPRGLVTVLEQDTVTMDATDELVVYALGGDDSLSIDALFTQLGTLPWRRLSDGAHPQRTLIHLLNPSIVFLR